MADGPRLRVLDRSGQVEIFLHGPIEPGMAKAYAAELKAAGSRPVLVRLHSEGGDWLEASAMYAATQAHPGRTTALVEGLAASSASFLLQAFNERRIAENALVMVHGPTITSHGTAEAHEAAVQVLRAVSGRLAAAYSRSGQPSAVIDQWLAGEVWFDAEAALKAHLVDAIDQPARVAAHLDLDLSKFRNVPPALLAALGRGPAAQSSSNEDKMDAITERPDDTPAIAASAGAGPSVAAIRAAYKAGETLNLVSEVGRLLDAGTDPDAIPGLLIEAHARQQAAISNVQRIFPADVQIIRDERVTFAARVVDALHARLVGKAPPEHARELRAMRLVDIAERVGNQGRERGWFDAPQAAGLHTTSDFPEILGTAAQRSLLDFYQVAQSPMMQLSRRNDAVDFRAKTRVRLGEAPALAEVGEGGEVTYGTVGEAAESYQLATYGKIFALSRQAIVNDDLGAFADQVRWWAQAVASLEASKLVAALSATLSDTKALFHADHGNLAGSGGAISTTTLSAGRVAMRTQKGVDGVEIVGAAPRFLLVGATKETEAQTVLASIYAAQASNVNAFSGVLSLLVEPRISGNTWYLFADPAVLPTIEHAYLSRQPGPSLQVREGFEVLGSEYRVTMDFAAAAIDFRGCFKNPGA